MTEKSMRNTTPCPKVVTFGELLLRLTPPSHVRFVQAESFDAFYGGSEFNVAVSLANYKADVEFVTRLPDNEIGHRAAMEMKKWSVGNRHIAFGGERLGIYFLEKGAMARKSKVLYDRSHSAMAQIEPDSIDWSEVFKDADWFHWSGITPAISAKAAHCCTHAVFTANAMGLRVSCDLNYRSSLWKYTDNPASVMDTMLDKTHLVVCNEEDADRFFGLKPERNSYRSVCTQLTSRFDALDQVAISIRKSLSADHNVWSGIFYDSESFIQSKKYDLTHIVDRVGSGDAFAASIIHGLLNFDDNQHTLDFAVAASCLKHTIPGDVNIATQDEVIAVMAGNTSGRICR